MDGERGSERSIVRDAEFESVSSPSISSKNIFDSSAKPRHAIDLPHSTPTRKGLARVVSIINLKGGVGKTTSVINIAARVAELGLRVLIVDIDSQGIVQQGLELTSQKLRIQPRHSF